MNGHTLPVTDACTVFATQLPATKAQLKTKIAEALAEAASDVFTGKIGKLIAERADIKLKIYEILGANVPTLKPVDPDADPDVPTPLPSETWLDELVVLSEDLAKINNAICVVGKIQEKYFAGTLPCDDSTAAPKEK